MGANEFKKGERKQTCAHTEMPSLLSRKGEKKKGERVIQGRAVLEQSAAF